MNQKKYYRTLNSPLLEINDSRIIVTGFIVFILLTIPSFIRIYFEYKLIYVIVIRLLSLLYVLHKVESLNRNRLFWGLIAVLYPPLALIILGLSNFKIHIKPIKEIIKNYRLKYNSEISKLKKTEQYTINAELKLKNEYQIALKMQFLKNWVN